MAATSTTALAVPRLALNGEKTYISNGGIADVYVIIARTGKHRGEGFRRSCCLRQRQAVGAERIEVIAPHPLAHLALRDVICRKRALIGRAGMALNRRCRCWMFRSTVGRQLCFARRALDEAQAR